MEYITLNDGNKIPVAGIGTFMLQPDEAQNSVKAALGCGYELIDTANAYMNEKAVGRGMKESGKKRGEIYLVTKLWPSIYGDADKAIDDTLKRLETDYIDLLFLHQPAGEYEAAYKAIERAVKSGKVKSIGLSNFDEFNFPKLEKIVENCEIKPAVLQVEAHPYYPQGKFMEYLDSFGAKIMAWYPLGHGDKELLNEEIFAKLGEKYGKTPAQVILRWHTQMGNIVIPGSKNEEHIKDNLNIFDFTLTEEEMNAVAELDKNVRYYHSSEEALVNYAAFNPPFDQQL